MRAGAACIAAVCALTAAGQADAGAWTKKKGQAQVIAKLEAMRATEGFDAAGQRVPLPAERRDEALSVFAEYGLTDRLTLQLKGDLQRGEDAFVDYEGRGPIEIGVTWQVWRDERNAVSLYAGYADGGEGRNAGYAPPGQGDSDWEVRASAGRSFGEATPWDTNPSFIEVQVARRFREGLPDETRVDLTYGHHLNPSWMVLSQLFAGATDDDGAQWVSLENSVVYNRGTWSFQAGWRNAADGRETPAASGPMIALWRRF
ncbi:MAG: hypothetical protein ACK4FG_01455 [Brevundimonas sp.]